MNALLLGNGFDLYYKFPTRYIDFLNTVEFITSTSWTAPISVGDIFKSEKLQERNKYIKESYIHHESLYHATDVPIEFVEKLATMAKENMWYTFLVSAFNKDIGWIDFESQINSVIAAFKDFLVSPSLTFSIKEYPKEPLSRHIIQQFDFFLSKESGPFYSIKKEYLIEEPMGSKLYRMNDPKWIGAIKKDLDELTEMLRLYLYHFVECPIFKMEPASMANEWFVKLQPEYVVTFNYTSTFERFCSSARVAHIHGHVNDKIVLGVNPNEDDDVNTADTTFIEFKKYLQRIILGTDTEYRSISDWVDRCNENLFLTVMGHSLDTTDEDIIREWFEYATDIAILYHSPHALKNYISKLIVLYGKDKFDIMRREKNLRFISLDNDLDGYVENILYQKRIHMC